MLGWLIVSFLGCSGGEASPEGEATPEGTALPGTLVLSDGTEVELEGQLYTDGSITVSGSDGTTSLELTVLDASSNSTWTTAETPWGSEVSTGPSPVVLSFSTATGSYSEVDILQVSWAPLDNGNYTAGILTSPDDYSDVRLGPTHPADFHCLSGDAPGDPWRPLYCEEQTIEQFYDGGPEDYCSNSWQHGLCPLDSVLGFCEGDDGEGSYWFEATCELVPGPQPDGTGGDGTPGELCTEEGGTWTEAGEGTCE